nr:phage holin family protein [Streptococcus constellatus]
MVQFEWIQALKNASNTQEKLIVYTLVLIMIAMVIDFLSGTLAAKINPDIQFRSKEGINGILRKIASIALLAYCIPLSVLLPEGVGLGALQILYTGYLFFELKSILENYEKLKFDTTLLREFVSKLFKNKGEDK